MAVKTKTVNLTRHGGQAGKKIVKKALTLKDRVEKKVENKEVIKKLNEEVKEKKELSAKDQVLVEKEKKEDTKVLPDKKYELTIDLKDMLGAGCHLGHKSSKIHPKSMENVYMVKDGIGIFDLVKTKAGLEKACNFIYNARRNGKSIVLLGTKRQAREVIKRVAMEAGVPYITDRWLGGTITNWDQIKKSLKKLGELKEGLVKGKFNTSTKKEISLINKEVTRLERIVGGLVGVDKLFDIIFVVDAGYEKTAIKEAKLKGVKVVAIVDNDADPRKADLAIPANDDSVKSVNLLVEEIGRCLKAAK